MLDNKHFVDLACTAPFCSTGEMLARMYYPTGYQRVSLCSLHISIMLQSYRFLTKNVQNVLFLSIFLIYSIPIIY